MDNPIDLYVFLNQSDTGDDVLLVRALDRFHRRLQALQKLLPEIGVGRYVPEIKFLSPIVWKKYIYI